MVALLMLACSSPSPEVACDKGDLEACAQVGQRKYFGLGSPPDLESARADFRKACIGGISAACSGLHIIDIRLDGGARRTNNLVEAIEQTCANNEPNSCFYAGWLKEQDNLVEQALAFYTRACEGGVHRGCAKRAGRLLREDMTTTQHSEGVNLAKASCEAGDGMSCSVLAFAYSVGVGLPNGKDLEQSARFYLKGCDLGEPIGCGNGGAALRLGRGVDKDHGRALELLTRACEWGYARGCWDLGNMHKMAQGTAQDHAKAIPLFEKACTNGVGEACNGLGAAYRFGQGVEPDRDEARKWFELGCSELGHDTSCMGLRAMR